MKAKSVQKDYIKFIFAKSLPYNLRMLLVFISIILGIIIQLFLNFWPGLVLIIIGTFLSLIHGYDAKITLNNNKEKWVQVTIDEFKKIKTKGKELRKWDTDAFDITNSLGGCLFFIIAGIVVFVWFILKMEFEGSNLSFYFIIDSIIIFAPQWFSATRDYLKNDQLIVKIGLLEEIIKYLSSRSDIQVSPMLEIRESKEGKGNVPTDARLLVRIQNAPDSFLGLQVQVSINSVQGHDYPYLYCVLIAKKGQGFLNRDDIIKGNKKFLKGEAKKVIFENTTSPDAEVLVIRQFTTETSGYHTDTKNAKSIVDAAIITANLFFS